MSIRARRVLVSALLSAWLASGCTLTEVTTAPGEDVLVVEGVLRSDRDVQEILLHRTLQGRVVYGAPGAQVAVQQENGARQVFREVAVETCTSVGKRFRSGEDSLDVRATCYVSPASAGRWVVPGGRYTLDVVTPRGERVRGSTQVPQSFDLRGLTRAVRLRNGDRSCVLPPYTPLPLVWSTSAGTWAYLTEMEARGLRNALAGSGLQDIPDPLQLTGVSVSAADTTLLVPTEVGVFERFSYDQDFLRAIQNGFPAGTQVDLVVAATDRNFVNSVRGGAFNPSGNVRVSSVVGDGVGVFGSLVARVLRVDVRPGVTNAPCLAG